MPPASWHARRPRVLVPRALTARASAAGAARCPRTSVRSAWPPCMPVPIAASVRDGGRAVDYVPGRGGGGLGRGPVVGRNPLRIRVFGVGIQHLLGACREFTADFGLDPEARQRRHCRQRRRCASGTRRVRGGPVRRCRRTYQLCAAMLTGSSRMLMAFDTGVFDLRATWSSGTSGFVSG